MNASESRVLVLGATGGFGGAVAARLIAAGRSVRAMARDPAKLSDFDGLETVSGDMLVPGDLARAAEGCGVIVHGVNVPYPDWPKVVEPMLEATIDAAAKTGARIVFPGNVYGFHPDDGPVFAEGAAQDRPPSKKGAIRARMEARLAQAVKDRGVSATIVRAGDYFGPTAPSAWFNVIVATKGDRLALRYPGDPGVPHSWAYLPDVAEIVARLLERQADLPAFGAYHVAGYEVTAHDLVAALAEATGKPVKLETFPWWALNLAAPFMPLFRELKEMRYLWDRRVALDDAGLRAVIGEVPRTPLIEAARRTLTSR